MNLQEFETSIGYQFKNKDLLKIALTHKSYANDNNLESNEKLEFLGDAILEFVVSKYLYSNFKKLKEGEMTKVRATVVCEKSLYNISKKYNFSDVLYLGKSELKSNGHKKPAILADSVEAVIAAIYLDSGIENTEQFIINNLKEQIEFESNNVGAKDYKTVLQEILQKDGNVEIEYNIIEETGPDHDKEFVVEVRCNKKRLAVGKGTTKKKAEMDAAKTAIGGAKK